MSLHTQQHIAWSGYIFYKKATLMGFHLFWGVLMRESAMRLKHIKLYAEKPECSTDALPDVLLQLNNVLHVEPKGRSRIGSKTTKFEFQVLATSGRYHFAARTEEECSNWVEKLISFLFGPPEPGIVYEFQVQVLPTSPAEKLRLNGQYAMRVSDTEVMLYSANGALPTQFCCALANIAKVRHTPVAELHEDGSKLGLLVIQTDRNALQTGEGGFAFSARSAADIASTINYRKNQVGVPLSPCLVPVAQLQQRGSAPFPNLQSLPCSPRELVSLVSSKLMPAPKPQKPPVATKPQGISPSAQAKLPLKTMVSTPDLKLTRKSAVLRRKFSAAPIVALARPTRPPPPTPPPPYALRRSPSDPEKTVQVSEFPPEMKSASLPSQYTRLESHSKNPEKSQTGGESCSQRRGSDFESVDDWVAPEPKPTNKCGVRPTFIQHLEKTLHSIPESVLQQPHTSPTEQQSEESPYITVLSSDHKHSGGAEAQASPKVSDAKEKRKARTSQRLKRSNSDASLRGSVRQRGSIRFHEDPDITIELQHNISFIDDVVTLRDLPTPPFLPVESQTNGSVTPYSILLREPRDDEVAPYSVLLYREEKKDEEEDDGADAPYSVVEYEEDITNRPPAILPSSDVSSLELSMLLYRKEEEKEEEEEDDGADAPYSVVVYEEDSITNRPPAILPSSAESSLDFSSSGAYDYVSNRPYRKVKPKKMATYVDRRRQDNGSPRSPRADDHSQITSRSKPGRSPQPTSTTSKPVPPPRPLSTYDIVS